MSVLAVIGWVLLGLLALVVLLLVAPITAVVRFEHGILTVHVWVLFVRFRVFPLAKKAKKPKKVKAKKEKSKKQDAQQQEQEQTQKDSAFAKRVAMLKRAMRASKPAIAFVVRHLAVRRVQLVLPVHSADAAATALQCARAQAALGSLRAVLDGRLSVRWRRLQIFPDFTGEMQGYLFFACNIVLVPVIMLIAGFIFLKEYTRRRPYSKQAYKQAIEEKKRGRAA